MKRFLMFDLLITPWIVRTLYVFGQIILIPICQKIANQMFYGTDELTFGVLFMVLSVPIWRLICESWIVLFKISENTSIMKDK